MVRYVTIIILGTHDRRGSRDERVDDGGIDPSGIDVFRGLYGSEWTGLDSLESSASSRGVSSAHSWYDEISR